MGCHALLQGIFLTRRLNPHLFTPPALVGRFFTTGATWEVLCFLQRACQDSLPWQQKRAGGEDAEDRRYIKVWSFVCFGSHKNRFRRKTPMSVFSPRSVCDLPVRVTSLWRMNLYDDKKKITEKCRASSSLGPEGAASLLP